MPIDPLTSDRPLIVYLDFKSPYAYLAWEPTRAMARELGVAVDWRPFVLDIPSYLGSASLDRSGKVATQSRSRSQWSGVKYAYFDCRRYANLRGLTVRGTEKIWDTNLAAVGMLWAKNQGDAVLERYIDAVYEPFWRRALDVEDVAVIRRVLIDAGADVEGFEDYARGPGTVENDALQEAAFDAGIFGVPTYVVDGQVFFGREHLPRIRWHLNGRIGPPPDVAYEGPGDMPVAPAQSLEVCIDFGDAGSYLAVQPTLALSRELGIDIQWHPLARAGRRPPLEAPSGHDRSSRHRRFRARSLEADLGRYAPHPLPESPPVNSRAAAAGLLWAAVHAPERCTEYVARVFELVWQQAAPVVTAQDIERVFIEIGIPCVGFETYAEDRGGDALDEVAVELQSKGVIGTPTYLLDDEPYLGRQHLPLVKSRLGARSSGTTPEGGEGGETGRPA